MAQGVLGRLRPRIFLTFGTTRVAGRHLTHRPPLPQKKSLVLIFRGRVDPRAHGSVGSYGKNSQLLTPPGIDPETIRPVAQCLNHYATLCHIVQTVNEATQHTLHTLQLNPALTSLAQHSNIIRLH